jgi:cytochrome c peroxidase
MAKTISDLFMGYPSTSPFSRSLLHQTPIEDIGSVDFLQKYHLFSTGFADMIVAQDISGGEMIKLISLAAVAILSVSDHDFYDDGKPSAAKVELGKNLFFDKILSGNENISCATCHHPMAGTGDGLSLPVGEGGNGLGVTRDTGTVPDDIHERVPRNAPPVFNLGAREFVRMFHDGRVEADPLEPGGFLSPAGDQLPDGLDNVLAAQAMFPVTSGTEMAGQVTENEQADAAWANILAGPGGVWNIIALKLQAIPEYVDLFMAAYPGEINSAGHITYVHAANAIAAFEARDWRFDNSPFDRYLRGEKKALSIEARIGMDVFYGKGGCGGCHSGPFQTDHDFHAIAMPQIGPGKGDNLFDHMDGRDDFGRERVTGYAGDRFRFRTPTLRNVALSPPYGHAGAFDSLEAMVRHHLDPVRSLENYDTDQATLPSRPDLDQIDFAVMENDDRRGAIAAASELDPVHLNERDIRALMAFLHALTDPAALDMRRDVPSRVPSGLPIWD